MPSLKVSGFSLNLLEKLSVTRKSGLTFAVETPHDAFQMAINKEVTRDSVVAILEEAKKRGWKSAKFYFMLGLPVPASTEIKTEEEEIVDFIIYIWRRTKMHFNINVGIFIPKPHTPYQWALQADTKKASEKIEFIRLKLKPLGHKVSIPETLISQIESLLSRGDEKAGLLFEQAYLGGSRLDAWNEYLDKDIWRKLIDDNYSSSDKENPSWEIVDSGTTQEYFIKETENSNNCKRTSSCDEKCSFCGVCGKDIKIIKNSKRYVNYTNDKVNDHNIKKSDPSINRLIFSFSKNKSAVFHGHLSLIEIFSFTFRRAGLPVTYTKGFNPIAKIEFASPLSTGISADCEFAAVELPDDFLKEYSPDFFIESMNKYFPEGFLIKNAEIFHIPCGAKKHSLSSLLWGFEYVNDINNDFIKAGNDKVYRHDRLNNYPDLKRAYFSLRRKEVLARNITGSDDNEWISYFKAYQFLYNN
jgi:hypothetical protein